MASADLNLFGMLPSSSFGLNRLGHVVSQRELTRPSERPVR